MAISIKEAALDEHFPGGAIVVIPVQSSGVVAPADNTGTVMSPSDSSSLASPLINKDYLKEKSLLQILIAKFH